MWLAFFILTIASATSFPDLATIVLARFRPTILLQSHASDDAENISHAILLVAIYYVYNTNLWIFQLHDKWSNFIFFLPSFNNLQQLSSVIRNILVWSSSSLRSNVSLLKSSKTSVHLVSRFNSWCFLALE